MPRCLHCKEKFTPKYFLQKFCMEKDECISAFAEWNKEYKKKQEAKKWRKEKKVLKEKLISVDEYRSKYVQPIINEIARLIDYGQPCIATGNYEGKMAGGHYISVGSNRTTALNLHNVHIQSFHSNSWKGGDDRRYRLGLIETYGNEYFEKVEALAQIKPIKLTKQDLIDVKKKATEIRNRLKKNPIKYPPKARIKLREKFNKEIGIYK